MYNKIIPKKVVNFLVSPIIIVLICLCVCYIVIFSGSHEHALSQFTLDKLSFNYYSSSQNAQANAVIAVVTFVGKRSDVTLARVLAYSLHKTNPSFTRILYYRPDTLHEKDLCLLKSAGWTTELFTGAFDLVNSKNEVMTNGFEVDVLRAELFSLTDYGAILYLDPYMLVTDSLQNLVHQGFDSAFALDVDSERVHAFTDPGFLLLRPNKSRYKYVAGMLPEKAKIAEKQPMEFSPLAIVLFASSFRVPYKYNFKLEFVHLPDEFNKVWPIAAILNFRSEKPTPPTNNPSDSRYKPFFDKWFNTYHSLISDNSFSGQACST